MMEAEREPSLVVDSVGHACPQPVIDLANAVATIEPGEVVELRADDPTADVDVPVWCRMRRQRLVSATRDGDVFVFRVERTS